MFINPAEALDYMLRVRLRAFLAYTGLGRWSVSANVLDFDAPFMKAI
jgi:hypothetical protein